jgi:hypothetical protein
LDNILLWITEIITSCDNFSEDLDFDCKQLSEAGFTEMTNGVLSFLQRSGWRV